MQGASPRALGPGAGSLAKSPGPRRREPRQGGARQSHGSAPSPWPYLLCRAYFPLTWPLPSQPGVGQLQEEGTGHSGAPGRRAGGGGADSQGRPATGGQGQGQPWARGARKPALNQGVRSLNPRWAHVWTTDLNSSWMAGSTGTAERGKDAHFSSIARFPLRRRAPPPCARPGHIQPPRGPARGLLQDGGDPSRALGAGRHGRTSDPFGPRAMPLLLSVHLHLQGEKAVSVLPAGVLGTMSLCEGGSAPGEGPGSLPAMFKNNKQDLGPAGALQGKTLMRTHGGQST